jgi:hypothetical protein
MTLSKVEIERLSVISSKSFEEVLATLEAAVGHLLAYNLDRSHILHL